MSTPAPSLLRVLLVENSLPVRWRLRRLIQEACPAEIVGETGSVEEALQLFDAHRPDAVVLDLQLDDGDGCLISSQIKSGNASCAVIVLSNFGTSAFRHWALSSGADHFFDKALEFDRVLEVLRDLASRRSARV